MSEGLIQINIAHVCEGDELKDAHVCEGDELKDATNINKLSWAIS